MAEKKEQLIQKCVQTGIENIKYPAKEMKTELLETYW